MSDYYIPNKIKKAVETRANGNCEYCLLLSDYSGHPFCIDHIFPGSKGGLSDLENLAFCCPNCNGSKYNKVTGLDPLSQTEIALFNPRLQLWQTHFVWDISKTKIIGITPCGRATVEALKMNELKVQNLRKALHAFGVFPPD